MGPPDPKQTRDAHLLAELYAELRGLAAAAMSAERPHHTMQPTELVHEAWLRLARREDLGQSERGHILCMAATAMRRVLIEHARKRHAAKRSRDRARPLDADPTATDREDYLLALDEALNRLFEQDPELGRVVELRFFGGLTVEETARSLGVSTRTVKRDWRVAKAWLHAALTHGDENAT